MATFQKNASGTWRAIIRRTGLSTSRSFRRKVDAVAWATEIEHGLNNGQSPSTASRKHTLTMSYLINQHIEDACDAGKAPKRSKISTLERLKRSIGNWNTSDLTRENLIDFAKRRKRDGAGPPTIAADFSYINTVVTVANAVHGYKIDTTGIQEARLACSRLSLIGPSEKRDRRPTRAELERLYAYFNGNPRRIIPMTRIVRFAICSAMRQEEICRLQWKDLDEENRTILVRERKDPRRKHSNNQIVPLVDFIGEDPMAIMLEELQGGRDRVGRIFPYNNESVGSAFTNACHALEIEDLHFHDLRHEATSRLFEAGLNIAQAARITGHKDWKQLQRYTHLSPSQVSPVLASWNAGSGALPKEVVEQIRGVFADCITGLNDNNLDDRAARSAKVH